MSSAARVLDDQTLAGIVAFHKNLQKLVNEKMLETEELISNNSHDKFLKPLDVRINDFLIELEENGQCPNVSEEGKELFQEVLHQNLIAFPSEEKWQ